MTTREKVIVGIMCLTVVYGAYDLFGGGGKKTQPAVRTQERPMEDVRRFATDMTQRMAAQRISAEHRHIIDQAGAEWTKDPFIGSVASLGAQPEAVREPVRRPSASTPTAPVFAYTGFLQVGTEKLAIINGMEYARGDALGTGGHYVQGISAQRVTIGVVNSPETIHVPLRDVD